MTTKQLSPRDKASLRGETKYVGNVCARGHEPAIRNTRDGACLACKEERREALNTDTPIAYINGVSARTRGLPKVAPSRLSEVMRYWWLAGWNDRDMELTGCTN
jgi:hypothetical protein